MYTVQLLDIARCAKESEAAVLRAAYERRTSRHVRAKELGDTESVGAGKELWRVPPPPVMEGVEGEGGAPSPKALPWAEVSTCAVLCAWSEQGNAFEDANRLTRYVHGLYALYAVRSSLDDATQILCRLRAVVYRSKNKRRLLSYRFPKLSLLPLGRMYKHKESYHVDTRYAI